MDLGRLLRAILSWLAGEAGAGATRPPGAAARVAPAPIPPTSDAPAAPEVAPEPESMEGSVDPRPTVAHMRRRVSAAFNPAQPVEDRSQLLGRSSELGQLMRAMLDLRAHAVLFGARGAGKTSLVRAFGDHADERGHVVLYMSCGAGGDFPGTFRPYLADIPEACFAPEDRAAARAALATLPTEFDARGLAAVLARVTMRDVIMVVDEFDQVKDPATLREIAALIKLLSDLRARVQILFVGIAGNVAELIDAHPSLRRHLVAVPLGRFDPAGVDALFAHGEQRTGFRFAPAARALIATLAAGSPYHLRLFCFCAGMAAIDRRSAEIRRSDVENGLTAALSMWRSTNGPAAALFERLVSQSPSMRTTLATLARQSLRGDPTVPPSVPAHCPEEPPLLQRQRAAALAALTPALTPAADGTLAFDDPLAPQLLLATCYLAESAAGGKARATEPDPIIPTHREAFA